MTPRRAIRNIRGARSHPFPPSPRVCHPGCKESSNGFDRSSDFSLLGVWWEAWQVRGLVGNGERRPTRLMLLRTLVKKGDVLSEAAPGPHRPAGSDVTLTPPFSLGLLLRFSFTFFPTLSKGKALSRIRSACRSMCLPVWW